MTTEKSLKTTRPISTNLGTKHVGKKGIRFVQIEGQAIFQGDITDTEKH